MSFFRRSFLAVLFLGFALCPAVTQDLYSLAEIYYQDGLADLAITEYLRFLFFNPGHQRTSEAHYKISLCYIEENDWPAAQKHLLTAVDAATTTAERFERTFFLVEFLIAVGRYSDALEELSRCAQQDLGGAETARLLFLSGVVNVYLHDWEEANISFSTYFARTDAYPLHTQRAVIDLLSFARQTCWKNPDIARALSYIFPGSGQIYAGDFLEGFHSLFVTGLSAALVVWGMVSGDYVDAIVATLLVFQRFYFGGPFHARRIALESNEDKRNAINRAIFRLLVAP